jgi:hypothetical protein
MTTLTKPGAPRGAGGASTATAFAASASLAEGGDG